MVIWVTSNLVEVESETGLENETEEEEKRDDIVKADADDQYRRHRQRHASVPPGVPRSPSVAAPPCTCSSTLTHSGATLIMPPRQPSALPLERPSSLSSSHPHLRSHQGPRPRRKFKWNSSRRWDWKEVGMKCVLPGGMVYFVMAWLGEMRREWGYWVLGFGCRGGNVLIVEINYSIYFHCMALFLFLFPYSGCFMFFADHCSILPQ